MESELTPACCAASHPLLHLCLSVLSQAISTYIWADCCQSSHIRIGQTVLTGQVEDTQEEKNCPGYIHGFSPNLLLSCQILSVPLLTDASDIYTGPSFSPKCHLKTSSQSGVGSEKKWELIKFPCWMLCGMEFLQALQRTACLFLLLWGTQWLECVDRPELTLMKCLSSLGAIKASLIQRH